MDMPKVLENVRSAQIPVPVYEPITLPDLESRADVRDIHPLRCFDHLLIVIVLYVLRQIDSVAVIDKLEPI